MSEKQGYEVGKFDDRFNQSVSDVTVELQKLWLDLGDLTGETSWATDLLKRTIILMSDLFASGVRLASFTDQMNLIIEGTYTRSNSYESDYDDE